MRATKVVCGVAFMGILSSCAGSIDEPPGPSVAEQIDDYVESVGQLPATPSSVEESPRSQAEPEGDYSCTRQNLRETKQYDKIVAYGANSESLWPGAIVRGDSMTDGLLTQVVFPRKPLAFSISLENLAGRKSIRMEQPALSSFREAVSEVLSADVTGATPANIYAEIEKVHSANQLSIALGVDVDAITASVATSFNFDHQESKSRYLVKYMQAYYTVDVDQPEKASDFFSDDVTLGDVADKLEPGSAPVYVSSITYGRMILFTFESQYSSTELGAALDFVYRGGVDVSGDTSVTYKDIISNSKITAYVLGGSAGEAAKSIDSYEGLIEFIKSGGNYSKDSPGAPIAYKLAYLDDNASARLSMTQEYTIKDCVRVSQKVRVVLQSLHVDYDGGDAGGDLELFGQIQASIDGGGPSMLFDKSSDRYVVINDKETWPAEGVIAEGVIQVTPQPGQTIRLGANLFDFDPTSASDLIGHEELALPFETGWRREVTMRLTGSNARLDVKLKLEPI